jgi:hypothetical protein
MAKTKLTISQPYPRIGEGKKFAGMLDDERVAGHTGKPPIYKVNGHKPPKVKKPQNTRKEI